MYEIRNMQYLDERSTQEQIETCLLELKRLIEHAHRYFPEILTPDAVKPQWAHYPFNSELKYSAGQVSVLTGAISILKTLEKHGARFILDANGNLRICECDDFHNVSEGPELLRGNKRFQHPFIGPRVY